MDSQTQEDHSMTSWNNYKSLELLAVRSLFEYQDTKLREIIKSFVVPIPDESMIDYNRRLYAGILKMANTMTKTYNRVNRIHSWIDGVCDH